ncbi:MAG TPA: PSD1 and planctomycete cytochrome C domain-containing protein [Opitutaceae bacterium]|nr:PSD1 and planctomycete cytochrome C domain-containing protein [Opitutaceae bacterium]
MPPLLAAFGLAAPFLTAAPGPDEPLDFGRDVMPVLSANCFACHGADAGNRKARLRLDRREDAVADRDGLPVIVPGHPERSEVIARVTSDDEEERMPPPDRAHKLSEEQIGILRRWIAEGAPYTPHWAFEPARPAPPPPVKDRAWVRSPVDAFVLARLEAAGLPPARPASRETLIRRASLDLTGLPPSPEDVAAFVADGAPDAWPRLIERLLASPRYGERWGRHWLDVARYADSGGFETDLFFGHAWRFRDYVIRSFNDDKPFDRFIKEQIAGDELYPGDEEARLATGFYTIGPVLQEAGMVTGKLEYDQQTDAADTTGAAFLGLTVGCARCHDHKYDPVSQRDYFALQAVFAASDQADFTPAGTKLRERAALKSTLSEFETEQARLRALRETDPAQRARYVRQIGESFIASDRQFGARVEATRRYHVLRGAVDRFHRVLAAGAAAEPSAAAKFIEEEDGDDANLVAFKAELAGLLRSPSGSREEQELLELGVVALRNPERRRGGAGTGGDGPRPPSLREQFRAQPDPAARRAWLVELGRRQLDLQKPEGFLEDLDTLRDRLGQERLDDPNILPVRVLAHRETPFEVRLLHRGELEMPGDVVAPALLSQFAAQPDLGGVPPHRRRAALAEWIASPDHVLTARVIVNRVWQWHFGEGIVRTPNDFGLQGARPTHPELLDWLALEFVRHGWSLKHLHRVIMNSSAYRMGPTADARTLERDPDNLLLSRYQPRRLEAEAVWDSLLAASGRLNPTMYGLPFAPPLDEQEQIGNFRKWPVSTPDESYRRAVYLLVKRSFRFPTLSAFDLPDNITSCGRRDITTIPNQSLTLMNNAFVQELAGVFAERLLRETDGRPAAVADRAGRIAFGRALTPAEKKEAVRFLGGGRTADPAAVKDLCLGLFNTNEFIYLP